jgi:RNA polymerase sigma-70 factor, ECF subfamily
VLRQLGETIAQSRPKNLRAGASNLLMVQGNSIESGIEEILAGCLDGDRVAQQKLYERFHRTVYGLAVRLVGHCEADDLTQEIFLRVFAGLGSFRGDAGFSTWLYRVAINECLRYRRAARPAPETLAFEPPAADGRPGLRLEQTEMLEHALDCLEPPLRAVFLLRHGEGMDYKRISAVLGIPISTAATRLARARAELQRLLKSVVQGS